jgi:hypothetical protein
MAFSKSITTRGTSGSYLRIVGLRWDPQAREASALFALYVNKAHSDASKPTVPTAERQQPLVEIAAKLRLTGAAFDEYVGPDALASGASHAGTDLLAHLYTAAKEASKERARTGKLNPELQVISDYGADLFAAATLA